ncbi:hypothetical protein [uncultured Eubacterium sp.]|uniref:hypothetical protein n=1 Tax=uncultured Eubacterium sp. TaxID=165185 RepID=UPI002804C3C0|nr:hypothetical protein [uncultured Eubacterium sp.]
MNINPTALFKMKEMTEGFNARHPKLAMFFNDAGNRIEPGAVLELSVTDVNGEKIRTNFRVAPEDKELLDMLAGMIKK